MFNYTCGNSGTALQQFLCPDDIKTQIQAGHRPNQKILNEMCSHFGRKSEVMQVTCREISKDIKSKHHDITHVWAAYSLQHTNKITFVVLLEGKSRENKDANVWLDKLIEYSFISQFCGDFNTESEEAIKLQHTSPRNLDEKAYHNLQSVISRYSGDLMKRHKYLSVISASSHRSKGFGSNWEVIPEHCIVLYVHTKNYIPISEEPFEKSYGGISVDVREGVFIRYGNAKERLDHVQMGCKIQGFEFGTLGCFIDHPQFGVCGLTCAHIALNSSDMDKLKSEGTLMWPLNDLQKDIYQPDTQTTPIGYAVQYIYKEGSQDKSGVDVALFKITDRQPKSANFPDSTSNTGSKNIGLTYKNWRHCRVDRLDVNNNGVFKFGSTTELTDGIIEFDVVSVKEIQYPLLHDETFTIQLFKQLEIKPKTNGPNFAEVGDSGSLVFLRVSDTDHAYIGIVEGGTSYGTVIVTPIAPILEELNMHCLKSFDIETNFSSIQHQIQNLAVNIEIAFANVHAEMQRSNEGLQASIRTIAEHLQKNPR